MPFSTWIVREPRGVWAPKDAVIDWEQIRPNGFHFKTWKPLGRICSQSMTASLGAQTPLGSRTIQVEKGIHHFKHIGRSWTPTWLGWRDQGVQDRPQIGR